MKIHLKFVVWFAFLLTTKVMASINLDDFIAIETENAKQCEFFNEQYFKIIKKFYGSINLISYYFIHPNIPNESQFRLTSILLKELPRRLDCSLTYQLVDTECGCVKLTANRLQFLSVLKSDLESGVFIAVENIFSLEKIISIIPELLVDIKRRKTIIAITNTTDIHFESVASNLLVALWNIIHMANVIVITPCNYDPEIVRTYYPFEPIKIQNYTTWGACKIISTKEMNFDDISLVGKFKNFNGFPLRISFFQRFPTSMKLNELSLASQRSRILQDSWRLNFSGVDGLMLSSFVKTFNFTPILVKPRGVDFGYKAANGKFLGTIGEILSGRTLVSFIGHFINDYGTDELEYIYPYFADKLCIIAPKAQKIPEWMAIFQCYDKTVWISLLIINSICGWFWFFLKQIKFRTPNKRRRRMKQLNQSFGSVFIDMWVIMWSGPLNRLPFRKSECLFLATCLFSSVIFIGTFQSSLKTAFTAVAYYDDIHSLQQLDQRGLQIGTSSGSLKKVLGSMENVFGARNFSNPIIKSLKEKYILINSSNPALDRVAYEGDICCIERLTDLKILLSYKYKANDGSTSLHIIEECLRSFYLGYILKKGSSFYPSFRIHVERLFEGGFVTFWYNYIEYSITTHRRLKAKPNRGGLSMIDLQIAFFILLIGSSLSTVLFILELVVHGRKPKKSIFVYAN